MRLSSILLALAAILLAAGLVVFRPSPGRAELGQMVRPGPPGASERDVRPAHRQKNSVRLGLAQAEERNGRLHGLGEAEPFSGTLDEEHPGGQKMAEIPMSEGVPHGTVRFYDEYGTLRKLARYEHGNLFDVRHWDRNGVESSGETEDGDPYGDLLAARERLLGGGVPESADRSLPVDDPGGPQAVTSIANLFEREGITYRVGTNQPYSGPAIRELEDGSRWERNYQNGQPHGEFNYYFPNGQLSSRESFANGVKDGFYTMWHENGQVRFEAEIRNLREVGITTTWDPQGNVLSRWEHTEDGQRIDLLSPPAEDTTAAQPEDPASPD